METEYKYTSHSERDTMELAQNIESEKFPNMVICLKGELGSGNKGKIKPAAAHIKYARFLAEKRDF